MNIKINKKLVSFLLAGTMSFSLCTCTKEEVVENVDSYAFNDVVLEVEDDSIVDEVFDEKEVSTVDPITLEENGTLSISEASNYLEEVVNLCEVIDQLGSVKMVEENAENADMIEIASTWSFDDAYKFVNDVYYASDVTRDFSNSRLCYYKAYLYRELKYNCVDLAYNVLDASIKSVALDANSGTLNNYDNISINNNSISYISDKEGFYDTEALALLATLDNVRNNIDSSDEVFGFDEYVSLIKNSLNKSKNLIYFGGELKDNIIDSKKLVL